MQRLLRTCCILLAALCLPDWMQQPQAAEVDTPQTRYIAQYAPIAVAEMQRSGVPASITLAQGLLESNAGQSTLAMQANNHFGIKCHKDWKGRRFTQDDDRRGECFRVYATAEQSFRDHSDFLRYRDRYKALFELQADDYKGWAKGLKAAGYATDRAYADKLIEIIERYDLTRFDARTEVQDLPPAPAVLEADATTPLPTEGKVREQYRFTLTRPVYERNGVLCIYALEDETYASIAEDHDLFLKELLFFNDLKEAAPLEAGAVVYLHLKKGQAARGLEKHVVEEGQSLWEIAQRYGIREQALRRLNHFAKDYSPAQGDMIRLRK